MSHKITVGILGATGYMGGEVLRVLLNHPNVDIAWATSRQGGLIEDFHPNLYGLKLKLIHPDDITRCDIAFMALPTTASLLAASRLLDLGCRVIDLGAAYRLNSRSIWEDVYQLEHSNWSLADEAVYGISELHLEDIKQARIIANPGCFASSAILGLSPLIKNELVDKKSIVVNGLSGTAGMGAGLSRAAHHPEIGNNLVSYNVVDHRHTYEMEQELSNLVNDAVQVHFTPTYVPITRGILNVCHAFKVKDFSRKQVLELYHDFYQQHPFVKIYDLEKDPNTEWQYKPYPWVSTVNGTNNCYIGLDIDEKRNRIVVFSVLDSLGKGGAQVGIENMNLMFNVERTTGLNNYSMHP